MHASKQPRQLTLSWWGSWGPQSTAVVLPLVLRGSCVHAWCSSAARAPPGAVMLTWKYITAVWSSCAAQNSFKTLYW